MANDKTVHDLNDFMTQITSGMADEYKRIWRQTIEDPGTAGDQGEENWAELLRSWLPTSYTVVTKGRLIGHDGTKTPQMDVIVLKPSYPPYLVNKKLYLAGGVAAVFECKNTLKAEHITDAVRDCIAVKKLFVSRHGTFYDELFSPIVFGLLAHSHNWKAEGSKPSKNIENQLQQKSNECVDHPRYLIDTVCVADTTAFTQHFFSMLLPQFFHGKATKPEFQPILDGIKPHVTSAFLEQGVVAQGNVWKPIGVLITDLARRLAWEDQSCRSLSEYYEWTDIRGSGLGVGHNWPVNSVYSEFTLNNWVPSVSGSDDPWNKWALHL